MLKLFGCFFYKVVWGSLAWPSLISFLGDSNSETQVQNDTHVKAWEERSNNVHGISLEVGGRDRNVMIVPVHLLVFHHSCHMDWHLVAHFGCVLAAWSEHHSCHMDWHWLLMELCLHVNFGRTPGYDYQYENKLDKLPIYMVSMTLGYTQMSSDQKTTWLNKN